MIDPNRLAIWTGSSTKRKALVEILEPSNIEKKVRCRIIRKGGVFIDAKDGDVVSVSINLLELADV